MILVLPLAGLREPALGALAWGAAAGLGEAVGALALYAGFRNAAFSVAGPLSAISSAGFSALAGLLLGERPGTLAMIGDRRSAPAHAARQRTGGADRPDRRGGGGPVLLCHACGSACRDSGSHLFVPGGDHRARPRVPGRAADRDQADRALPRGRVGRAYRCCRRGITRGPGQASSRNRKKNARRVSIRPEDPDRHVAEAPRREFGRGTAWLALRAPALGRLCDIGRMTAWKDVERAEPEFAQRVRGLFDGRRHKTIATVRADGSPRISGIEVAFEDGELAFGSMPDARKGADLGRDPRFALHSATIDPVEGAEAQWPGEAKISGRAIYAGPLPGDPTATASTPTSPRSCTPTSTRRPRCSSLSGGPPRTGCAGSSASNPRQRAR